MSGYFFNGPTKKKKKISWTDPPKLFKEPIDLQRKSDQSAKKKIKIYVPTELIEKILRIHFFAGKNWNVMDVRKIIIFKMK